MNYIRNKAASSSIISITPEDLNEYFVNLTNNLMKTMTTSLDPLLYFTNAKENLQSFFFTPVVTAELSTTIKEIGNKFILFGNGWAYR